MIRKNKKKAALARYSFAFFFLIVHRPLKREQPMTVRGTVIAQNVTQMMEKMSSSIIIIRQLERVCAIGRGRALRDSPRALLNETRVTR